MAEVLEFQDATTYPTHFQIVGPGTPSLRRRTVWSLTTQ
jgi:hypothetical protein